MCLLYEGPRKNDTLKFHHSVLLQRAAGLRLFPIEMGRFTATTEYADLHSSSGSHVASVMQEYSGVSARDKLAYQSPRNTRVPTAKEVVEFVLL